jgi:hypothetical protein
MSIYTVIEKIKIMRQATDPSSPELKKALTRIGGVLQGTMRMNIVRMKAVGRNSGLLDSIQYHIDDQTLSVGSYGIPYAARNEYGGPMTHRQVAAMFYYMRQEAQLTSVDISQKNAAPEDRVVTVNPDGTGRWRPRPFIGDALKNKRDFVIRTLRKVYEP